MEEEVNYDFSSMEISDKMDKALRDAMESFGSHTSEDVLREKAQNLLADKEKMSDLKNYCNVMGAIGMNAARLTFHHMIRAAKLRGNAKIKMEESIRNFSPTEEEPCLQVNFFNSQTKKHEIAYIRLNECPKTFKLDNQLQKLSKLIPMEKMKEIQHHIAQLTNFACKTYNEVANAHKHLIYEMFGDTEQSNRYIKYTIDVLNGTLYVNEEWPNRIGIYILLEGEY